MATSVATSAWLRAFMPKFAEAFFVPAYRNYAIRIALANLRDTFHWKDYVVSHGVPFTHATAIYALIKTPPYSDEFEDTNQAPEIWIVQNYYRFRAKLELFEYAPDTPGDGTIVTRLEKELTYTAIVNGTQTFYLAGVPLFIDLYINGLKQSKDDLTPMGDMLSVGDGYNIIIGDFVTVRYII